jgi:hypothetical protein
VSGVSCSFGAIDTNGNGMQISGLSILTILRKILGSFMDFVLFESYILDPKMVGELPCSTLAKIII